MIRTCYRCSRHTPHVELKGLDIWWLWMCSACGTKSGGHTR